MLTKVLKLLYLPPRLAALALVCSIVGAASGVLWGPAGLGIAGAALAFLLSWASFIDINRLVLPDVITLGLVVAGLALRLSGGFDAVASAAIGAAGGYLTLVGVAALYRRARHRAGLGMGDAKLFAAAGAWLGWTALPGVLLAASAAGLLFAVGVAFVRRRFDKEQRLAFGPFIASGFWAIWLLGPEGGFLEPWSTPL